MLNVWVPRAGYRPGVLRGDPTHWDAATGMEGPACPALSLAASSS